MIQYKHRASSYRALMLSGRLPRRRQHLTTPNSVLVLFHSVREAVSAHHATWCSEHSFEEEVVRAGVREGGTEEQARTGSPLRIHRGLGTHLSAPHPPVSIRRQLLVRAARARLEEAEKMELAGEAGGLAPVGRTAGAPSPHTHSKPMRHSRESPPGAA
ncbi:hypothetical protein B0H10DRAFT_2205485, partial [Mycena sp. CBHHK59/15]